MTASPRRIVLVALDGSQQAMRALPLARSVAGQLHAIPIAIHVSSFGQTEDEARTALRLDSAGFQEIPVWPRCGQAANEIILASQKPEVQLLVITTLAAGVPDRELGSVAREVAINASCPVLGLPPGITVEAAAARPLKRLLIPLDGTRTTASLIRPVTPLARYLGAFVDVLYVADSRPGYTPDRGDLATARYVDQQQHEWSLWADELKDRLCVECAGFSPGAEIGVFLRQGDPSGEIVRFAGEGRYDALVLVRRSKLEAGRAQVLSAVIRNSPCPILVVGGPN